MQSTRRFNRPTAKWMTTLLAVVTTTVFAADCARAQTTTPVDGMVGQVNGQAIYAQTVFETIHEQLGALGRSVSASAFESRSRELIANKLRELIIQKLLLTEAERDLTEQDEQRLQFFLQKQTEELLRALGQTSRILAERESVRLYGKPIDDILEEKRSAVLIQRFIQAKVTPQVVIRRKDVKRYYEDHLDQYRSKTRRVVRLIVANDQPDQTTVADEIEQMLTHGRPYFEIASDPRLNSLRPDDGGLWNGDGEIEGDQAFGGDIDAMMVRLKEGERSQRIAFNQRAAWILVEKITRGKEVSLREAQLQIEKNLRENQRAILFDQYRAEAYTKGNFSDVNEMTESLVKMAMVRYYQPPEMRQAASHQ